VRERFLSPYENFKYERWDYQKVLDGSEGKLLPDYLIIVYDRYNKRTLRFFLEYETASKPFDKFIIYNDFYGSRRWERTWWARLNRGFPTIIVITEGNKSRLLEQEAKENKWGLDFLIRTGEEIRKELGV
jgi:hypothetical protein